MPLVLKNRNQIEHLRPAGKLVAAAIDEVRPHVQPGVTTAELDAIAERFIRGRGALPTYKGYRGSSSTYPPFPGTICASVNEEICHGIPSSRQLKEGDVIGVDIGAQLNGWQGDICYTFAVGKIDANSQRLLEVTHSALERGIAAAGPGKRMGDIGAAIQQYVEANGFSIVREYTGHGLGRRLHEEPTVLHYGQAGTGLVMRPGLVFTIEPMVNAGRPDTKVLRDGWTVVTADRSRSAQFEHTIVITDNGVQILSAL
jgi:methionyl aminopeptidase